MKDTFKQRLEFIYKNSDTAEKYSAVLSKMVEEAVIQPESKNEKWNEKDAILITYGDSIKTEDEKPVHTLHRFMKKHMDNALSYIHILPFFPFSSDDGFSVIDYKVVDPKLGTWKDVTEMSKDYALMADLVINHISAQSEWFTNYLQGKEPGASYFIEADPAKDYSAVTRPRSLPLLTPFETPDGTKHLWTTFSDDQIDLNFANPQVLIEMADVLLHYMKQGAKIIRLDAIAFLWKKDNTTCLHLPETHEVVKLLRDIMEAVDKNAILLTETNVPNKENLSYFGNGDEAHMVYQFSLPPLLLHALHTGNAQYLTEWARSIPQLEGNCTFFNFTASHDGIGVRPLEGLLPQDEFDTLVQNMQKFGGKISTRKTPEGTDVPYEMNITYFDACKGSAKGEDNLHIQRFLCSQTVMMSVKGIPAFYIHSLTATPNYYDGVKETGRARTINRMKWDKDTLENALESDTPTQIVFDEIKRLLEIRKTQKAFHPDAKQKVIDTDKDLFVIKRIADNGSKLLSISNMTDTPITLDCSELGSYSKDIIRNITIRQTEELGPYQTMWLV